LRTLHVFGGELSIFCDRVQHYCLEISSWGICRRRSEQFEI